MAKDETKEDIQFDREELTHADRETADIAREKRNSPMPEKYREDQSGLGDWPVHEGRKPAAMPADSVDSLDYKMATYDKVDEAHREQEAGDLGSTGDVARDEYRRLQRSGKDQNEIQGPPSAAAVIAAEGGGAKSDPVPEVDPKTGKPVTASLANPTEKKAK